MGTTSSFSQKTSSTPVEAESANRLIKLVSDWGKDKGIDNPHSQYIKFSEEAGEIAHELSRGNLDTPEMKDALGDTMVTLIILADTLGQDIIECLGLAYNVIANRTGKTVNGGFIKDE